MKRHSREDLFNFLNCKFIGRDFNFYEQKLIDEIFELIESLDMDK